MTLEKCPKCDRGGVQRIRMSSDTAEHNLKAIKTLRDFVRRADARDPFAGGYVFLPTLAIGAAIVLDAAGLLKVYSCSSCGTFIQRPGWL